MFLYIFTTFSKLFIFSIVFTARKLADMNPEDPEGSISPVFGFKRGLIRVVGNVSEEKVNQDLVI